LSDGISPTTHPWASDPPPVNLVRGGDTSDLLAENQGMMWVVTTPRHGNRPLRIPEQWPVNQTLPGAVHVGFFDGHVGRVPLEQLWQLHWHRNYVAPTQRPGLR
jgi:prepilin-type processing-associated H-X9-DG protein